MVTNKVNFHLLCKSCNRQEHAGAYIKASRSFINYSRKELIEGWTVLNAIFKTECSNCKSKGQWIIWSIWCGERRPKQIHIQVTKSNGNFAVDLFDENSISLNHKLEQLPASNLSCKLLSRAVLKLYREVETIALKNDEGYNLFEYDVIQSWQTNESLFSKGDVFYAIYEEHIDISDGAGLPRFGYVVYIVNTIKELNDVKLEELLLHVEQTYCL